MHNVNRPILRCILMVYYITNQNSTSCNILLFCVCPYCVICLFNKMFTALLCKFSKICIKSIVFHIKTNNSTVKKLKHQTSMGTLPVLVSQFFQINYQHTSINILSHESRSNIDIKSKIIIIAIKLTRK